MSARNREEFLLFWNNNQDFRENFPELFKKELEKKFGKAPYEFLTTGDGVDPRLLSRKFLTLQNPTYQQQHVAPNSINFGKPQFVDLLGRKYKIGTGDFVNMKRDAGEIDSFEEPIRDVDKVIGKVLLWICMPRNSILESPLIGETIELLHIPSKILCVGKIQECFVGPKTLTGYAILADFSSLGKTSSKIDNSIFNHVLDTRSEYYKRIKKS